MNQADQGNNSGAPENVPVKRKRGRPRKDQSQKQGQSARAPPGFEKANGNQPHQVERAEDANDVMLGQAISGVIDAAFDAGYLLTVRVGNSDTTLKGVVFKPGHYVPISAENDVAPNVQMIKRNEVPLPTQNQGHGRSRERNEQYANRHRNETSNLMASKGKHVPALPAQPAHAVPSRGNVVPVVLQPVNLSNGIPPATQAPHLASMKGKQVPPLALQAAPFSNGSTIANQVPTIANQALSGIQNDSKPVRQNMGEAPNDTKAKSMGLPGVPFEMLLGEVIKRIQGPTQSAEIQSEYDKSSGKLSMKDAGFMSETEIPNMNEPLLIKPLQAVQPDHNQSVCVPKSLENDRTRKMTELLQENMTQNQVTPIQHPDTDSRLSSRETGSPETELEDNEGAHSKKRSRASSV